ncbi:MAG: WD40 repeat domain-containing protein, partial [Anaerolineae bacterium]|nr:WD40 repeat domain-containing protein [Anaerolineae bacterium]
EHSKNVSGIAFAAAGQLISCSEDETIRLWDLRSGSSLKFATLALQSRSPFRAIAYSETAKTVATGTRANIQIWNLSGSLLTNFLENTHPTTCLAFSPNGRYLACGGEDGNIRFWNVTDKSAVGMQLEHKAAVHDVTYSPDGQWVATGADDGKTRLWDAQTGKLVRAFELSSRPVFSVAFSPDGSVLATAGDTGNIHLWNPLNGTLIHTLYKHDAPVHCVAFSPRVIILASGSADGTVQIWSVIP